jgi:hypothetical protein
MNNERLIGAYIPTKTTERYGINREEGLTLTRTESVSNFTAYDATERGQDVVFSCDITFPNPAVDGQLFKMGGTGTGCWVGIRGGGTVFRLRASDGAEDAPTTNSSDNALLDITDFPQDDEVHNVTWEFKVNQGRIRLWIDGVFKGESYAKSGPMKNSIWTGTNTGAYITTASDTGPAGEPATAWQGTNQGSGLRVYTNQLVTNDEVSNKKNSGIWKLNSQYSASLNSDWELSNGFFVELPTPTFSDTDTTSWQFTSQPLGSKDDVDRVMYIIPQYEYVAANGLVTVSSLTVGNLDAKCLLLGSAYTSNYGIAEIWKVTIPAGTGSSATITVNTPFATAPYRLSIGTMIVYGERGYQTAVNVGTNNSITLPVVEKGAVFSGFHCVDDVAVTWPSDLTQTFDSAVTNSELLYAKDDTILSTENKQYSVTQANSGGILIGISVW